MADRPCTTSNRATSLDKILVTPGLELSAREFLVSRLPGHPITVLKRDGSIPEGAEDAGIVLWCDISNATIGRTLEQSPAVSWIHACTAGVDQLWHPEISRRRIQVTRSPNAAALPVAEWALAAILSLAKRFEYFETMQQQRRWGDADRVELLGKSIGIIGTGAIGSAIAERAAAFGMTVVGVNRTGSDHPAFDETHAITDIGDVLSDLDFVTLALPLTDETSGLIGARELSAMSSSAFLVNVARGALVDEEALVAAVRDGSIAGAFVDVFTSEPLSPSSPLWDTPGITVSPHSAWRSPSSHRRAVLDFIDNLQRREAGELLDQVLFDGPASRVATP